MSQNVNRYTGYIYCAGKNKDGANCSMPVKKDGDFCHKHNGKAT